MRLSFQLQYGLSLLLVLFASVAADCKIQIRFMTWNGGGAEGEALRRAIAAFEARNPDVGVALTLAPQSGYYQRYLQMSAAGNAPDVFEIDAQDSWKLVTDPTYPIVEDLSRYLGDGKKITDGLIKEYVSLFTYRNFLSAIPLRYAVPALAYNIGIFQDAGLPQLPTPAQFAGRNLWNLPSFLSAARKLTKRKTGDTPAKADIWGYGEYAHWTWDYWVYGNGGSLLRQDKDSPPDMPRCDLDSDEAKQGLQFQSDLAYRWKVAPSTGYFVDDFAFGRMAMVLGTGPMFAKWKAGGPGLRWGLSSFPADHKTYVRISAQGLAISRQSRRKLYAWDFVRFMASPEAQRILSQGNPWAMPSNLAVARSEAFAGTKSNEFQEVLVQQALKADSKRNPFGVPLPENFLPTLTLQLAESWARKETAEVAVARMVPKLNAVLDYGYRRRAKRQKQVAGS